MTLHVSHGMYTMLLATHTRVRIMYTIILTFTTPVWLNRTIMHWNATAGWYDKSWCARTVCIQHSLRMPAIFVPVNASFTWSHLTFHQHSAVTEETTSTLSPPIHQLSLHRYTIQSNSIQLATLLIRKNMRKQQETLQKQIAVMYYCNASSSFHSNTYCRAQETLWSTIPIVASRQNIHKLATKA